MDYLGLWLYTFSSLFRPADWWGPLLNQPLDFFVFIFMFVGALVAGKVPRVLEVAWTREAKIIILYFATHLASILAAGAFDNLITYINLYFKLFVIYVAFAAFTDTHQKIKWLLVLFVFIAALLAYQSIEMMETKIGWAGQDMYWGDRVRWIGMYNGANVLCMLFDIAMAFGIALAFGPWGLGIRIFGVISCGLIAYGIYLTNSRSGYLAFAVVVAVYLLLRWDVLKRISLKKLIVAAMASLFIMIIGPSRMESLADAEHSSAGRIDAWQEGIEMLRANPLLGVGQGEWMKHHYRFAHNSAVQTMGEAGALGLFTWILMLFVFLRHLLLITKDTQDPVEKTLAIALLAAFSGMLASSFFVTTTQFDLTYIFFGLTSALMLPQRTSLPITQKDLIYVGTFEFILVGAIYLTMRIFYSVT